MNQSHSRPRYSGQGLVEFALILPMLLFVVMGIVDFSRAMVVYAQGSGAIRNAARYAEVWGGAAADNHQYLECGDGEAIKNLAGQVMFASVTTEIIFVKKNHFDVGNDFVDDGEYTITCAEAKANPDALETGDLLILRSRGSFKPITPLITNLLPTASFDFRAQRTIITNLNIGETTSTSGNGIVNCSVGSTQPEVTVRASRPTSVAEGGNTIFTFSLCEPSTETVRANYTVDGTASLSDYNGIASSTVTFTPGQQSVSIPVSILEDEDQESTSETIVVTLTAIQEGTAEIGTPSVATVVIMNDNPSGLCSQLQIHVTWLSWGALRFKIQNVGSQDYNYEDLALYYYFTSSSGNTMGADASKQTGDNVFLTTQTVQTGSTGYLKITVPGTGTLQGSSSDYVSGSLQLHEGSSYNFGNISNLNDDPSSEGVSTDGIPVLVHKVPLTVSETVVCGEQPSGTSGGSTSYPTVSITPGSTSVNEGSTANMTVSLSAATTSDVIVEISLTGNVSSSDYSVVSSGYVSATSPHMVTIPAGQTSVPLNILISDDLDQELQETLVVTLFDVTTDNANRHFSANLTNIVIPANDAMPTLVISPSTVSVAEGSSTNLTFTLSGVATSNVYVQYTLGGTASPGDYSPSTTPGSITIPMGQTTATLNLSITEETTQEDAETVIVTFSVTSNNATVGSPSSATITIPANDAPSTVTIAVSPASVNEGATVRFTATRTQPLTQAATVAYTASGGTAMSGSDYPVTSGTFTFAANEATKYIDVVMTEDTAVEGNETFTFALSSPSGVVLGTPSSVDVMIVDNDVPTISISGEGNVNEGSSRDLTVTLSTPSPQTVKVQCTVSAASTATLTTDYTIASGTGYVGCNQQIVFAPNETTKTIRINAIDESPSLDEVDETVIITLSAPELATIGTATAQVTIVDTDLPPTATISSPTALESASSITFDVTLDKASAKTVRIYFTVSPGTATAGDDYTVPSTLWVDFTAGQTSKQFVVSLISNHVASTSETFTVTITNQDGNTTISGTGQGTATLQDVPAPTANLRVQINYHQNPSKELTPYFTIYNDGTTNVNLNDVEIRYYFTREGSNSLAFECWWSPISCGNIVRDYIPVSPTVTGANYYLRLRFTGNYNLAQNSNTGVSQIRISTSPWTDLTISNDFSYQSGALNGFVNNPLMSIRVNGTRVYGADPAGVP